jgi:hypothetical protein
MFNRHLQVLNARSGEFGSIFTTVKATADWGDAGHLRHTVLE